jgi:protocatechuate 4,5-dioxygenase alpha subunit
MEHVMADQPKKEYDDIPGTFVFDADQSRKGYHVNMFCMSLMKEANRKAFKANEAEYLKKYPMTAEQRDAILKRDWNRILELGGNIYFTAKLGRQHAGGLRRHDDQGRAPGRRQSLQVRMGRQEPWLG